MTGQTLRDDLSVQVGSIVFPSHVAYVHNKGALLDMQRKEGALMLKVTVNPLHS